MLKEITTSASSSDRDIEPVLTAEGGVERDTISLGALGSAVKGDEVQITVLLGAVSLGMLGATTDATGVAAEVGVVQITVSLGTMDAAVAGGVAQIVVSLGAVSLVAVSLGAMGATTDAMGAAAEVGVVQITVSLGTMDAAVVGGVAHIVVSLGAVSLGPMSLGTVSLGALGATTGAMGAAAGGGVVQITVSLGTMDVAVAGGVARIVVSLGAVSCGGPISSSLKVNTAGIGGGGGVSAAATGRVGVPKISWRDGDAGCIAADRKGTRWSETGILRSRD